MCTGEDSKEGSGSDSEASSMEEDSEEGRPLRKKKLSLDARRQQRAAGDHPLQQRFKELSGALLKKHVGGDSGECISLLTLQYCIHQEIPLRLFRIIEDCSK